MGHFSHTCKLTGIPITGGTKVVLFPIKHKEHIYEYSEADLMRYGTTYQCSNDGTSLKFEPCWFPIRGTYDDYGGMEDIEHDDNTEVLEKYYDLTIEQIVSILTCGRKDDGYSDELECVKDLSKPDEYGKPNYQERYVELLSISGMWIHQEVFDRVTSERDDDEYNRIDLGNFKILEAFGFKQIADDLTYDRDENGKCRYKYQFQKDDLIVHTDGTWLNIKESSIYCLTDFAKYCEKHGTSIDLEKHGHKDIVEQTFDYIIPSIASVKNWSDYTRDELEALTKKQMDKIMSLSSSNSRELSRIKRLLLNHSDYKISNPLTALYFEAAKAGKLKKTVVDFWRFDKAMYCLGRYYEPVGTAPQDGEHKTVKKVLNIACDIIDKIVKERYDEYYEDEVE